MQRLKQKRKEVAKAASVEPTERRDAMEFLSIVLRLLARGYVVEMRAHHSASYSAVVRNSMDVILGDLQYRDAFDEDTLEAQGISYACHTHDPERFAPDTALQLIMEIVR